MKLITGDKLNAYTRAEVLRAYTYRLTIENGYPARNPCGATVPPISDAQWLAEHAFWVTNSGRLALNRTHAEPAYILKGGK